ncbi:hypothetical protein K4039_02915 [Lyngbya sp. CCAP 1446/10]|uniref:hypothetical protein n=1 Tax=Lyngbya sp. CCAP 1446/10 TaxID=439293 RepID=UPI00223836D9|nr:hypothetical protein [Lyngbya sp. CCAP 1446/10]MCW6049056.1 hypothetical protein [Lyngbya sp. CCAP 1446/10]
MWKTLLDRPKQFLWENGRAIDFSQLFHKFSTGIYELQLKHNKQLFYFSTVSTGRSHKNNSIKKNCSANCQLFLVASVNSQLTTDNCQQTTVNCQLSTVNCQLPTAISFL